MRRNNLVEAALAATALAAACQGAAAERKEKPNVLFIAIDDMKPLMGCYGDKTAVTPNIDKLASRSVVFLNNQCQWPVCGPSRASIMTGLRPERTGVMNLKTKMRSVHPDILTIPQYFKENGYVTVGRGKIFDPRCVK
jgi:arylsulfatase A-like enzyme